MKERPILFSAPMVRAMLEGRKTQTRRVAKRIPWRDGANPNFSQARAFSNAGEFRIAGSEEMTTGFRCPYGQPGDRLWVRETYFGNHFQHPNEPEDERELHYRADGLPDFEGEESLIRWRPSIHMPRWACRLVLEVTDVRMERLQEISREDEIAEGTPDGMFFDALWSSINGAESWAANPWVWVVSFRRA